MVYIRVTHENLQDKSVMSYGDDRGHRSCLLTRTLTPIMRMDTHYIHATKAKQMASPPIRATDSMTLVGEEGGRATKEQTNQQP
jgi:hypothetical protein